MSGSARRTGQAAAPAAAALAHAAISQARSLLFVPGDRPERHAKALAAGADAVIIDLEDAVAPAKKTEAAEGLRATWGTLATTPNRPPLLLRCNPPGTFWFEADLALVAAIRPDGLVLPKTESPAQLAEVVARLGAASPGTVLLPLIESATGLAAVRAIAASGHAQRLLLGHLDLQADLGMQCADDERELDSVRLEIVLASRLAGLPAPVDGVSVAISDAQRLALDVQRSLRFGYTGKLCIHPGQVAGVHQAFAPTPERLAWAQRVMDALASGAGTAVQVDGKMVDAPVIKLAQQVLASARV